MSLLRPVALAPALALAAALAPASAAILAPAPVLALPPALAAAVAPALCLTPVLAFALDPVLQLLLLLLLLLRPNPRSTPRPQTLNPLTPDPPTARSIQNGSGCHRNPRVQAVFLELKFSGSLLGNK